MVLSLVLALAGATSPEVTWSAPAGCPAAEHAREAITGRLEPETELAIDVRVREADGQFHADVAIRGPAGSSSRSLSSPSCSTLLEAVTLIAVAAESDATLEVPATPASGEDEIRETEADPPPDRAEPSEPEVATSDDAPPDPEPDSADLPVAAATPRPRARPRRARPGLAVHGRLFAELGWSVTPLLDYGGGAALGLSRGRVRGELFGGVLGPTSMAIEGTAGRLRVHAWSVGGRGCGIAWTSASERLALPICGAAEIGQLVGSGIDVPMPRTHRDLWVAARLGPALLVRLTSIVSFVGAVDAIASLQRPGFALSGGPDLYNPAFFGVRVSAGVEVHFPRRIRRADGNE